MAHLDVPNVVVDIFGLTGLEYTSDIRGESGTKRLPASQGSAWGSGAWSSSRLLWGVGVLLAGWALIPQLWLLFIAIRHGGVLTGNDGAWTGADQFQYLAWIRESANHGLIADPFQLAPSHAVFLHPMFLISGVLWRLGLAIQLAYLMWKPVAVLVLLGGFAAYTRRADRGFAGVVALVLALFYLSPALPALAWTGHLHGLNWWNLVFGVFSFSAAWQLWGYMPAAIALGLMPLALLWGMRALTERSGPRRRWLFAASVSGALIAWLHPWQGATLVLIWIGLFAWRRGGRTYRLLLWPALGVVTPLIYYLVLEHADATWKLAQTQTVTPHLYLWTLVAASAPLILIATPALLTSAQNDYERVTRLWVLAGLAVYFATNAAPFHALEGLSLPLAVLAIAGWRRLSLGRWLAAAGTAVCVVPGAIWLASFYRGNYHARSTPYVFSASEAAALNFLNRSPGNKGVLATYYLGMAVPAYAGHNSWIGHFTWSPQAAWRVQQANSLLSGQLQPAQAQAFVRATGARYVLADCNQGADLRALLGPIIFAIHSFGCVTVYAVD